MDNNLNFSQRMGLTPATKAIQIESIDEDLKIRLWNVLYSQIFTLQSRCSPSCIFVVFNKKISMKSMKYAGQMNVFSFNL